MDDIRLFAWTLQVVGGCGVGSQGKRRSVAVCCHLYPAFLRLNKGKVGDGMAYGQGDDSNVGAGFTSANSAFLDATILQRLLRRSVAGETSHSSVALDDWLMQRRARKRRNLETHVDAVGDKIDVQILDLNQIGLVLDWCDHAQDIDPEDHELTALWRGSLQEICHGSQWAGEMLAALSQVRSNEAGILLSASDNWPEAKMDDSAIDRLQAAGLLSRHPSSNPKQKKNLWELVFFISTFLAVVMGFIIPALMKSFTSRYYAIGISKEISDLPWEEINDLLFLLLLMLSFVSVLSGLFCVYFSWWRRGKVRLTELGRHLRDSGRAYSRSRW